jgi:hypothetical protein
MKVNCIRPIAGRERGGLAGEAGHDTRGGLVGNTFTGIYALSGGG